MAIKERLHEMYIQPVVAPISEAFTSLKAAAIASTLCVDTLGFESNMLVLQIGATAATNMIITLCENDTSTATQGTTVTGKDVIFAVDDNDALYPGTSLVDNVYGAVGQWVQSTGVLTATTAPAGRMFMFAYTGKKRYIRLLADNGSSTSAVYSVFSIQGDFRYRGRAGLWNDAYGANTSTSGPTMQ